MASAENRRRKHSKREDEVRSFWNFFSHADNQGNDFTRSTFFDRNEGDGEDEESGRGHSFLGELWLRFNFWSLVATLLFLLFTGALAYTVIRMWQPQDLKDIAGYADSGAPSRDLAQIICNANGAPIRITEGELNRYLRDTCRMRQTGIFSIIANAQGLAIRVHEGYAELIIDRIIGSNMHQTTAVNLTFHQENDHGRPALKVELQGGEPLLGRMPRGGRIGRIGVPQRHMLVLKPALETLLGCYPDIVAAIEEHGYCPIFEKGSDRQEGLITLVPYTPQ